MQVRCDNQYKTEADGGNILGQPMLFECMDICALSPAHENEMRGFLVYLVIENFLLILFKLDGLYVEVLGGFLKHFKRGLWTISVIGNRRSFIYCGPATPQHCLSRTQSCRSAGTVGYSWPLCAGTGPTEARTAGPQTYRTRRNSSSRRTEANLKWSNSRQTSSASASVPVLTDCISHCTC